MVDNECHMLTIVRQKTCLRNKHEISTKYIRSNLLFLFALFQKGFTVDSQNTSGSRRGEAGPYLNATRTDAGAKACQPTHIEKSISTE